jgi:putative methanogen marker protein 4
MIQMVLLDKFLEKAKDKKIKIGIGIGNSQEQFRTILKGILGFLSSNQADILLFGQKIYEESALLEQIDSKSKYNINFINTDNPEDDIIEFLKARKVDGVIRGGLSSSGFLQSIKTILNVQEINRLALLETFNGSQFFFGPVGIDECNTKKAKISYLNRALKLLRLMDIIPNISILSGGRKGDIGRDSSVDKTIKDAEQIVSYFKNNYPDLNISHDEILIEKAISNKTNLILAPNGVSGNLVYRTLVHLGGGKAYGAIYIGLKDVIIDTSRVGESSEIEGALVLATSLYSDK